MDGNKRKKMVAIWMDRRAHKFLLKIILKNMCKSMKITLAVALNLWYSRFTEYRS